LTNSAFWSRKNSIIAVKIAQRYSARYQKFLRCARAALFLFKIGCASISGLKCNNHALKVIVAVINVIMYLVKFLNLPIPFFYLST
jgi:hypothetical protein